MLYQFKHGNMDSDILPRYSEYFLLIPLEVLEMFDAFFDFTNFTDKIYIYFTLYGKSNNLK